MLLLTIFGVVALLLSYSTTNAAVIGRDRYLDYDLDGIDAYYDDHPTQCFVNLGFYETGQKMQSSDPCKDCICNNGRKVCKEVECSYPEGYNDECTKKLIPGECCAIITCPHLTELNEAVSAIPKAEQYSHYKLETGINGQNAVSGMPKRDQHSLYELEHTINSPNAEPVTSDSDLHGYDLEHGIDVHNPDDPSQCSVYSRLYETGQKIQLSDPCQDCICNYGMMVCKKFECSHPEGYNDECTKNWIPGECCPNITCPLLTNFKESDPVLRNTVHEANDTISNSNVYSKGSRLIFGILCILLLVILLYAVAYFRLP